MSVEVSKHGNSIYLKVGIWYDEQKDHIHLAVRDVEGFHTTVTRNPSSKRGHPNLFMKLARALKEAGAPHPVMDQAATDEDNGSVS